MMKQINNIESITQPYYKVVCDFHPADRKHFQSITADIFRVCNCAVFYREGETESNDGEYTVRKANLYILIVSSNVLTDPSFDDSLFNMARQYNIPILPILVENGIEDPFNRKFGNLQCISTCLELIDPTAVPYTVKLRNYLSQIFSLSFDIDLLRSAFDSSIFLSYRKKDRAYAQRLLDVIHSYEELKSISVWYDEFLTPGEDFNDSIKNELEKSALFMLMVTPSILEEKNYIKLIEYPLATNLGKTILPVELVDTDPERLAAGYPRIPESVNIGRADRVKSSIIDLLRKNNIEITERTAERDFYIGLAFLKGLCVEKNPAIALEMISRGAEAGVAPAIGMLAYAYKQGDGCELSTEKAAFWQKKYIALQQKQYEDDRVWENAEAVEAGFRELSDIYACGKQYDAATEALMEVVEFYRNSAFSETVEGKRHCAQAYEDAAEICFKAGEYPRGRNMFLSSAIDLWKKLYESGEDPLAELDLCHAYTVLAKCQMDTDDIMGLKVTVKVDMKELREVLLSWSPYGEDTASPERLKKKLFCLSEMGRCLNKLEMETHLAFLFNGAAVNFAEVIHTRIKTVASAMHLYTALRNDAMQHIHINVDNHQRAAQRSLERAHEIVLPLQEQNESTEILLAVAESYLNLGRVYHNRKEKDATLNNIRTAINLYQKIQEKNPSAPGKRKICTAYYEAAGILAECKKKEEALTLLDKSLEIYDEFMENSTLSVFKLETADVLLLKGEILKGQWEFEEALKCYERRHSLITAGAHKNVHIHLIAESYQTLIGANKAVGEFERVKELTMQLEAFKTQYSYVFNGNVKMYK